MAKFEGWVATFERWVTKFRGKGGHCLRRVMGG